MTCGSLLPRIRKRLGRRPLTERDVVRGELPERAGAAQMPANPQAEASVFQRGLGRRAPRLTAEDCGNAVDECSTASGDSRLPKRVGAVTRW